MSKVINLDNYKQEKKEKKCKSLNLNIQKSIPKTYLEKYSEMSEDKRKELNSWLEM